jgi:hypothetical protein
MTDLYRELEDANRQVAACHEHVEDQMARIVKLQHEGDDPSEAKTKLREFELVLARIIELREHILHALVAKQRISGFTH